MTTWWNSAPWHAYERAYGDVPGTRAALLAEDRWLTRVLDLTQSETDLWRGVRRSYHPIVNKLTKDPAFTITRLNSTAFLDVCRPIQLRLEGGETRSHLSWIAQAEWLIGGPLVPVGMCWAASRAGVPVAFLYVIIWGDWAYYGFSKQEEPNAHHALMWHVIQTLKAADVRWLELGWQGEARDEKGKAIEFFKRGWGGKDVATVLSGCAGCLDMRAHSDEGTCARCARVWTLESMCPEDFRYERG